MYRVPRTAAQLEVIRLLLERGANPNLKDGTRAEAAYHRRNTPLDLALELGRNDVAKRPLLLPIVQLLRASVAARAPGPPEPPLTDEEWHNQWLE